MEKAAKRLVLIGCAHSGSRFSDINEFKRYVDLARAPGTHLLILGDLFENAIPARGEGMMFEQSLTPDNQIDEVARILHPFRHKIVGACTSNHSRRSYKEVGLDMDKQLYARLGVPGAYKGLQGVVVFEGRRVAFAHGHGSGDNWNDAKKLYAIYPEADVVAVSHRHEMTSKWYGSFRIDGRGRRTRKHALFVRTGGLMDWPAYAQEVLYSPQKPGFSVVTFPGGGAEPEVDVNGLSAG